MRKNSASRGKYADVYAAHGRAGFAVPERAPDVGSFPLYPINRARYALAIVAAPAYDDKSATRERVIKAIVKAWPKLAAEAKHVRATVEKRMSLRYRRVANPKFRK